MTPVPSFGKNPVRQQTAVIAAIIVAAGVVGFTAWRFLMPAPNIDDVAVNSDIDPAFFSANNPPPPPPPAPIEVSPTPPQTPQTQIVYRQAPPPPKSDLFDGESSAADIERDRIAAINILRARSSRTMAIAESGKGSDKTSGFTHMEGHFDVETAIASDSVYLNRVMTADRMIGALLINEVISDLPGQITAQIEEDIYGFHGRDILIPRGSRAIGRYVPLQRIGEERLMATWDRIITPEGVNINLRDAQLADTMGRTGGYGEVDRRLAERYGLSIMLSTLTAGIGYQMNNQSSDPNTAQTANTYTTALADVTAQILREQINIQPRITIPAGSRIFINPIHDLFFPLTSSGSVFVQPFYKGDQK